MVDITNHGWQFYRVSYIKRNTYTMRLHSLEENHQLADAFEMYYSVLKMFITNSQRDECIE